MAKTIRDEIREISTEIDSIRTQLALKWDPSQRAFQAKMAADADAVRDAGFAANAIGVKLHRAGRRAFRARSGHAEILMRVDAVLSRVDATLAMIRHICPEAPVSIAKGRRTWYEARAALAKKILRNKPAKK